MKEFQRALPVTDVDVTGRVLEGLTLRWDHPYRVTDDGKVFYLEGWRKRAFEQGLRATGNFHEARIDHADVRVGRVSFMEVSDGLAFTTTADETPAGDALLAHADSHRVRGVSLGFGSDRQVRTNGIVWRKRAVARELSFIVHGVPQYSDAGITARRDEHGTEEEAPDLEDVATEATEADVQAALDLEALIERSKQLAAIDVTLL